ncbi:hypothetical protein METBIDRAFT_190629 [Metschnikowia bicuspidata var. bicuspidata NRRL YB-4993]|uniref:Uncharacterized protein n=1 Tax=Metschnikowia bicuspidata var. bicuspidata NRRL YB-4993 TaxID=869754 RepID=A0A1A0HCF5_9ASCO|nr:hypothetical protein METBIDRAFT_190629 [Metschnikowia bicuspidata var. bicuspidata NRRL YB-4993]OBA21676.1 hypothetical protein METBIDRAFT_190629 [Metschnikowia bicuspidata var. bicuspidata NRRL YB-4993]
MASCLFSGITSCLFSGIYYLVFIASYIPNEPPGACPTPGPGDARRRPTGATARGLDLAQPPFQGPLQASPLSQLVLLHLESSLAQDRVHVDCVVGPVLGKRAGRSLCRHGVRQRGPAGISDPRLVQSLELGERREHGRGHAGRRRQEAGFLRHRGKQPRHRHGEPLEKTGSKHVEFVQPGLVRAQRFFFLTSVYGCAASHTVWARWVWRPFITSVVSSRVVNSRVVNSSMCGTWGPGILQTNRNKPLFTGRVFPRHVRGDYMAEIM